MPIRGRIEGPRVDGDAVTHAVAIPPWRARRTRGAALQDDEEAAAALPPLGDDPARRNVDLVRARGDEGELLLGAAAEERHRAQPLDAGVSHAGESSVGSVLSTCSQDASR